MKKLYQSPCAEIAVLKAESLICASGTNGSNEDFGKGAGFSFDLFEAVKPF
ncbi:MAG: hypothetical protein MJY60_00960 [Bacteroidales bacterium]|nr:hypothetical protein [Bacteroidales bacterium]